MRKGRFNQFNYLVDTPGPMGKSVEDLVIGTKISCGSEVHCLDPSTTPLPWNERYFQSVQQPETAKIKIGVLEPDPFMPVTEAVKRAMLQTQQALIELGYEVVPFHFTKEEWSEQRELFFAMVANGSAGKEIADFRASGESMLPT